MRQKKIQKYGFVVSELVAGSGEQDKEHHLDYLIALGYQINIALGIFPEIDKHSLLNNCSFGKNFKKLINIALSTCRNIVD